jgi:hypothetical protein
VRTDRIKIYFKLTQDTDEYPPVAVEAVWAKVHQMPNEFKIDNIPFFTHDVTLDDIVTAIQVDDIYWYQNTLHWSQNSLIRIVFFNLTYKPLVNDQLINMGCTTEYFGEYKLLSVNIPIDIELTNIQEYLKQQATLGSLDYEEAVLRQ